MSTSTELSACAEPCTTRRAALAMGAAAGAAMLAGCSVYGESSGGDAAPVPETPDAGASAGGASQDAEPDAGATEDDAAGGAPALAQTSDIPVGSGKIFADQAVVVTQPTEGTFKAFSNVCTHQGCTVDEIKGGTINCPCHGSKFAIADGSVTDGPANKALAAKKITVDGDSLRLA